MLIDFHTHCFPDKIFSRVIATLEENIVKIQGENYPAEVDGSLGGLINSMRDDMVDYSVVLPIATTPKQTQSINKFAASINGHDGIFSFGSLHPDGEDYDRVLENIKEQGLKGIKIHPEYQGVFVDSKEVIRIVKKAEELGLYVVFHAGRDIGMPEPVHCTPKRMRELLQYVSGDKIIAAHFGSWRMWDDVEEYIVGTPIMIDTSYSYGFIPNEQAFRIVKNHGSEKILFGTDSPWKRAVKTKAFLDNLGLNSNELDNIYYRNAANILGLEV